MDKAQGCDSGDWNLALGKSALLLLGKLFNSRSLNFPKRNQRRYFLAPTLLPYSLMMQLLRGMSHSDESAEDNKMIDSSVDALGCSRVRKRQPLPPFSP